jgi:mono/diheme cytochrome c family protein
LDALARIISELICKTQKMAGADVWVCTEQPGGFVFRFTAVAAAIAFSFALAGCRQDMHDQPKFVPQRGSAFFEDGRSARTQLAGTVARGQDQSGDYFTTGMINGKEGDALPFPATLPVLERGQERFNIYCSPCHSRVGNGEGRIVERGYYQAADFQSERLRQAPLGHFFNVMTHGLGAMPDYHAELAPADRWAIVAYIRALQLSQEAKTDDAAPGARIISLTQAAAEQGLPPEFADADWTGKTAPPLPSIAVAAPAQPAAAAATTANAATSATPQQDNQSSPVTAPQPGAPSATGDQPTAAAGDPAAGRQLYMDNCAVCHQPSRQGLPPIFPSLVGIVDKVGAAKIRATVMTGIPTAKPPMPSFASKFSSTDLDNLIAFLKTKP